jgi:hypothetical protein
MHFAASDRALATDRVIPRKAMPKPLGRRVNVVELQGRKAPAISTEVTGAARLGDEDRFDAPPAGGYAFSPAAEAPIVACGAHPREGGRPVLSAVPLDSVRATTAGNRAESRSLRREPVAAEPVVNRLLPAADPGGDLTNRKAPADKGLERIALDSTLGGVLGVRRREPVLLQPIPDRRRMTIDDRADPLQGVAAPKTVLKELLLHANACSRRRRTEPQTRLARRCPGGTTVRG